MGIAHKGHGEGDKGSQHQLENLELKALLARGNANDSPSYTYILCPTPSEAQLILMTNTTN